MALAWGWGEGRVFPVRGLGQGIAAAGLGILLCCCPARAGQELWSPQGPPGYSRGYTVDAKTARPVVPRSVSVEEVADKVAGVVSALTGAAARVVLYDKPGSVGLRRAQTVAEVHAGEYSALFSQLGVSMTTQDERDRWFGSAGLGQRWFPSGRGASAGFFGYNLFLDQGLSRDNSRGGLGMEAGNSWLAAATNYYFPLSGWRRTEDQWERPREGWDTTVRGMLPLVPGLSVSGSYAQWSGQEGSLPAVWSYGLELALSPMVSAYVNRRVAGEQNDISLGVNISMELTFPWDQTSRPARTATFTDVPAPGGRERPREDLRFVDRNDVPELEFSCGR